MRPPRFETPAFREVEGFDRVYIDCASNTYSRMLRHHGRDPRVLGDRWRYRYSADTAWAFARLSIDNPYDAVIGRWYGMTERYLRHDDPPAAWDHVREVVAGGGVVAVTVDLFVMPNSAYHGRYHYPHRVVVPDVDGDEALVLDGRGPLRTAEWTPIGELSAAMATPELADGPWGPDVRNVTVDLLAPEGPPHAPSAELIRAELAADVADHLETGRAAAGEFARDVRSVALTEDRVVPAMSLFGNLATQRRLNALFLDLAAESLDADLAPVASTFRRISHYWNKIFYTILFALRAERPVGPLLRTSLDGLDDLLADEHEAVLDLRRKLG